MTQVTAVCRVKTLLMLRLFPSCLEDGVERCVTLDAVSVGDRREKKSKFRPNSKHSSTFSQITKK